MALSIEVAVIWGSAMRPKEFGRIIARDDSCVEYS